MIFNFYVNQHLYLALARRDPGPLRMALAALPEIPAECQWANFLRNHDEANFDKLADHERAEVFEAFGPDPSMQLYGRGLRRRLPPMLGGDRRLIRFAYSLLFSLPPVLFYGEEIGMGENLDLEGRRAVRTPMQWQADPNGGFSTADELPRPAPKGEYGPERVNVAAQRDDPDSLLNWMGRLIRARRELPELGRGRRSLVDPGTSEVLGLRFDGARRSIVTLHHFSDREVEYGMEAEAVEEVWSDRDNSPADPAKLAIAGLGYRWLRLR